MTRVRVDPDQYRAASRVFGVDVAATASMATSGLEGSLAATTHMAGHDPAGAEWAGRYDIAADETVQAIDDLRRASITVGGLLEQTGFNHARADAHSDISGKSPVPPDTTSYVPGGPECAGIPSAAGGEFPAPDGWEWLTQLCGAVWPDGDPGKLRTAGQAWRSAASKLDSGNQQVSDGIATVRTQDSPEVDTACTVCGSLGTQLEDVATQCRHLANSCDALADGIDKAHSDLISQAEQFLAITAAIETAGLIAGLLTFGVGEGVAQAGEAGEVANIIARVAAALNALRGDAELAMAGIGDGAMDGVSASLRGILERTPVVADTEAVSGATEAGQAASALDAAAESVAAGRLAGIPGVSVTGGKIFVDGTEKMTTAEWEGIYDQSVHNASADGSMLGKFVDGGPTSYVTKAEDGGYRYFSLGTQWESIQEAHGLDNDQMFNLFNKPFLDDGISQGQTFYFSHNPEIERGTLLQEMYYLEDKNYQFDWTAMTGKPSH